MLAVAAGNDGLILSRSHKRRRLKAPQRAVGMISRVQAAVRALPAPALP
ncbi:hypothetical protein [Nocardia sp. NPDC051981]